MPSRSFPLSPGAPAWIELECADPAAAQRFYGALFGWTLAGSVFHTADGPAVAGLRRVDAAAAGWLTFVASPDAAATADAVAGAGGEVLDGARVADGVGSTVLLADPAGAVIGVLTPGELAGYEIWGEPGTPTWHELHSTALLAVLPFYGQGFGWGANVLSDTDEFRYYLATVNGDRVAGLFDVGASATTSTWQVYLGVADTDAALIRVGELGGTIVRQPWDSPFGRMAQVVDPGGAGFFLCSVPA